MKQLITAENPGKISKKLKLKWSKDLVRVISYTDKVTIIFLAEVLQILSNERASFSCVGTVDYDMFSGCDFSWTLSSGCFRIKREIKREISESWQRVEVDTDDVKIYGMDKYKFSWNGECGETLSKLRIEIDIEDSEQIGKIEELGRVLYEVFKIN